VPNFLTPSTQSTAAHRQAVEQIRYLHVLKLQHHAATLTTLARMALRKAETSSGQGGGGVGGRGSVGGVGGWGRSLTPHTPHTPHTQKASYIRALRLTSCHSLLPKVLPISSNSDGAVSPTAGDRQPQAEAKNAFKNLLVRNFRT